MGMTFYDLTCEELCELMCGKPEDDYEKEVLIIAENPCIDNFSNNHCISISEFIKEVEE